MKPVRMVKSSHRRTSDTAGTMRLNDTVYIFILIVSFLTSNGCCHEAETSASPRYRRGNPDGFMSEKGDPNFWPVRGRRYDKYQPSEEPPVKTSHNSFSFLRGGRIPKAEEVGGVFWAGRGRSYDVDGDFWAHRGRALSENAFINNLLSAEEPGWVYLGKGIMKPPKLEDDDHSFCSGTGKKVQKREIFRQKLCYLKRKSNTHLREVPEADQFWPVRGKKQELPHKRPTKSLPAEVEPFWPVRGKRGDEEETWQEELQNLKLVWPGKGQWDDDAAQEKSNGKENT